ncbi:capsule biosynthesis GfcC family protein [Halomonas denitrificans]|uniref:capsule biosynthesis GfcC family protein n=1 Tax=Halomonas denitrificans TaxID=370769 RepID=UPI000D3B76E5|nr:capsule biosynthesis GfcC family protein [Halomonas denitrificans]
MVANLALVPVLTMAASPPSSPRLSDWWLEREALPAPDTRPYYLLGTDAGEQQRLGRRLLAELTTLIGQAELGRPHLRQAGLMAWRQAIRRGLARGGRTPARADLAALLAHPRHDPPLASLDTIGVCQAPDWVEVWSREGVTRLPWTARMRLSDLLARLPPEALGTTQAARLVSPHRPPRRLGIAAWNAQEAELVPGSRLVLELSDDLPAAAWLNRHLPDFLATRLPGGSCTPLGPTPTASQRTRST